MGTQYRIIVKPHWQSPEKFGLFNDASGGWAGDRLYKGDDPKTPKKRWPFKAGENWTVHDTKPAAEKAAAKLQVYLDACESKKAKKVKGRKLTRFLRQPNPTFDLIEGSSYQNHAAQSR